MQASVVITIRPWLRAATTSVGTTTGASTSVANFSKWATNSLVPEFYSDLHSSSRHNRKTFGSRVSCRGALRRCEIGEDVSDSPTNLTMGETWEPGWGWNRQQSRLGLWGTTNDRRELSIARSRRGFLTELQSLKDEAKGGGAVEFESPLQIVMYPDPRLRNKNERITVFDGKLDQLVKEMFEVMYQEDGVGLAAPQVGVNVQLMLYNPEGERGKGVEYILVNPKIVKYGKQRDVFTEGCLSFSHLQADVERPLTVRVEAQDIKGKRFALSLKGWQARIFQHEYDHLEGILYHDRMSSEQLDSIRPGLEKLEQDYEKITGHPAPEKVGSRVRE